MNANEHNLPELLRIIAYPSIYRKDLEAAANLIESLESQLSESQARERAAVEVLSGIESCLICMPGGAGCSDYGNPTCYRCRRGPQEAEKGEAE